MVLVDNTTFEIELGQQNDNNTVVIAFSINDVLTQYGSQGTWSVINKRPYEDISYPIPSQHIEIDQNKLLWTITNTDTQYSGTGECQLLYSIGDDVKYSKTWKTKILRSLSNFGTTPTYIQQWIEQILRIASEAEISKEAITSMTVTAESVSPQSQAEVTASIDPSTGKWHLHFKVPKGAPGSFKMETVIELPEVGEESTLYLVPKDQPRTGDIFDEYFYINGVWELQGGFGLDLSNYYTKSEINQLFALKTDIPNVPVKGVKLNGTDLVPDQDGKVNVPRDVFVAEYGVTTLAQVQAALGSGKLVFMFKDNQLYFPVDRVGHYFFVSTQPLYNSTTGKYHPSVARYELKSDGWGNIARTSSLTTDNVRNSISASPDTSHILNEKVIIDNFEQKPTIITLAISPTDWTALADSSPYTYSVTKSVTIEDGSHARIINNNLKLFSKHCFGLDSATTTSVTIWSVGLPSTDVTLTLEVSK